MNRLLGVLVAAMAAVGIAAAGFVAVADDDDEEEDREFRAKLNGYEETPSVFTTGKGRLTVTLSADGTTLSYTLTYSGLEGTTTTAAHIHLGQRGVAGGVSAFLCGGSKPVCPNTAGTVSGTIVAADVVGPTAQGIAPGEFGELVTAIRDGMTYGNVHTNKHPGGEIRGQIR